MKFLSVSLIFAFFLQTTIALACQSHSMNVDVKSSETPPCHQSKESTETNKDDKKPLNCPVCEIGLCFQNSITTSEALITKPDNKQKETFFSKSHFEKTYHLGKLSKDLSPPKAPIYLAKNQNWQAFYSVFIH